MYSFKECKLNITDKISCLRHDILDAYIKNWSPTSCDQPS